MVELGSHPFDLIVGSIDAACSRGNDTSLRRIESIELHISITAPVQPIDIVGPVSIILVKWDVDRGLSIDDKCIGGAEINIGTGFVHVD